MALKQLFKSYQCGFDQFDPKLISTHYMTPCSISDGDGIQIFDSYDALCDKFSKNCRDLKAMDYRHSELMISDIKYLGVQSASVDLGWAITMGSQMIEFRCLYLCRLMDQRWYIYSALVYEGGANESSQ